MDRCLIRSKDSLILPDSGCISNILNNFVHIPADRYSDPAKSTRY